MLRHVLAYVTFILLPSSGLHCVSNGCLVHWFCLSRYLQGIPGAILINTRNSGIFVHFYFTKHPSKVCLEVGASSYPWLWLPESLMTLTNISRLNVFILDERFVVFFFFIFCLRTIFGPQDYIFFVPYTVGTFLPLDPMEVT